VAAVLQIHECKGEGAEDGQRLELGARIIKNGGLGPLKLRRLGKAKTYDVHSRNENRCRLIRAAAA